MKNLKYIWRFQLFYKKVLKQERQSIVKTNPPHLLQFRWYFNIQCKKYCNCMTVMTLSLSLLFIYVKFYLFLDSFCLLCKTICMPQVKWARNGNKDIVLYCAQLWFPVCGTTKYITQRKATVFFCKLKKIMFSILGTFTVIKILNNTIMY
jgi:hypothetical protein